MALMSLWNIFNSAPLLTEWWQQFLCELLKLPVNLLNFLNGIIHLPVLELCIIIVQEYQDEKLVSQQYKILSDCTAVQADLALCWWPKLITFGSSRIRVDWLQNRFLLYIHCT